MSREDKTAGAVELIERLTSWPHGAPQDDYRVTSVKALMYSAAEALTDAQQSDARVREALKTAVEHLEHMAAWISSGSEAHPGYSFEALGEDMPGIKAALASLTAPKPPCEICGGRGEVGGWSGQTAESGGWETMPCECVQAASPAPSRVEPVAWGDPVDVDLCWRRGEFVRAKVYEPARKLWRVYEGAEAVTIGLALTSPPDAQPRIEALEGAAKPFADITIPDDAKDHHPINYRPVSATFGDVKRLRAALQPGGDHGR